MRKRGNVELWIFLVFVVIALGGAIFVLQPQNPATGMSYQIGKEGGASYVPVVSGPGNLQYITLQCQAQCSGTAIETPRTQNPQERLGGAGLQQCLAWCRNKYRVAAEQVIPGEYDIDAVRIKQGSTIGEGPEMTYPRHLVPDEDITKVTQDDLPPVAPRGHYI
jgi:hypothetical protein